MSVCPLCSFVATHVKERFLTFLLQYIKMSELTSDDDEETVILASATIIFSSVHSCVITVLTVKGVIMCGLSSNQRICLIRHVCLLCPFVS